MTYPVQNAALFDYEPISQDLPYRPPYPGGESVFFQHFKQLNPPSRTENYQHLAKKKTDFVNVCLS